jgi:hypothetical protein
MPYQVVLESLETRLLRASTPWGTIPKLIRQDLAASQFPTVTGAGQAIAVIDTGIDYTHAFLGGGLGQGYKVVGGYDFVDDDSNPMDTYGHGTEVAGVLAATPFNYLGKHYQGAAPGANLIALRVDAANDPVPDERIEKALQWVLTNQATYNIVAVNISFGSGHYAGSQTSVYSDELAALKSKGVFVAAASGNGGVQTPGGVEYPAADPNVYSVGAVDAFDTITEYTERGANLDILAPGDDVVTTSPGPDDFTQSSGTSFATPFVCGTVALMRQANPNLRVGDILSILRGGSKENVDGDTEFGDVTNLTFSRLDMYDSLALAIARRPGPLGSTGEIATAGNGNAMAYDGDGVLHIAYYDSIEHTLQYVTRGTNGQVSSPLRIDNTGDDVGGYVSLAVDSHDRPGVAYFDGTSGDLKFAHFDGQFWNTETVDFKGSVGLYPSVTYDRADEPVISYFKKSTGDLRVARFDGTMWRVTPVDVTDIVGRSSNIAYNKVTDELAIAYEDSTHGWLKVATNFANTGWAIDVVDNLTLGVAYPSIAFDSVDNPAVSYYDVYHADLKFAQLGGNGWVTQKLASKGAQGLYTQLYFTGDGLANILYYSRRTNMVMKLTGGIPSWTATALQSGGGRYISAAVDPLDHSVAYSWFQPGVAKLRIAAL